MTTRCAKLAGALAAAAIALGCAGGERRGGALDPSSSSLTPLPSVLTCDGDVRQPSVPNVRLAPRTPPSAGQVTERFAKAKRLYDSEKWEPALATMREVADGATGDDEANRQLAEFYVAKALFQLKRHSESYAALHAIARRRDHAKHVDVLLWLARLAMKYPELVNLGDFAFYDREDVERFANPEQRDVWAALTYFVARERLAAGAKSTARELFTRVPKQHAYAAYARRCLEGIDGEAR